MAVLTFKANREWLAWAISIVVGTIAALGWLDDRYELFGTDKKSTFIMLNLLQRQQAADRYWLTEKEKKVGLDKYESGRKASLESSIDFIEEQKEAIK